MHTSISSNLNVVTRKLVCWDIVSFVKKFVHKKKMSGVFVQKLNPLSGDTEWEFQDENYDFHQEIARSAFADMLHDTDRNKKYYAALKKAVNSLRNAGKPVNVLDIGTGTGLLSMMAAVLKADSIIACEAFSPIASVAREVINSNGFSDKICVIGKRSTELEVGEGKDLPQRANLLITEVFDTELIGEGAIATFTHAKRNLLTEDAIVIPHLGRVYGCLVESDWLESHNRLRTTWHVPRITAKEDFESKKDNAQHIILTKLPSDSSKHDNESAKWEQDSSECGKNENMGVINIPETIANCPGSPSLHDIQLSQLPKDSFKIIAGPVEVFSFNFAKGNLNKRDASSVSLISEMDSTAHAVLMWWDLDMDKEGDIVISMAPEWTGDKNAAWRDHWMQAVYHLESPFTLSQGQKFNLVSSHDEFSFWFSVYTDKAKINDGGACVCGLHVTWPRSRLAAVNSTNLWTDSIRRISALLENNPSATLFLGDCSLLPLATAMLSKNTVYCVEPSATAFKSLKCIIRHNNLQNKLILLPSYEPSLIKHEIGLVYGEPYFRTCLYPWESLRFWYLIRQMCPTSKICPDKVYIKALPVHFDDLHKIRLPLGTVEDFNMAPFDDLVKNSSEICDSNMEVQPLWEYPGIALGHPVVMAEFNLYTDIPTKPVQHQGKLNVSVEGVCNGITVWTEWYHGDSLVSTTGLKSAVVPGCQPSWLPTCRQAVYLPAQPNIVSPSSNMTYSLIFDPDHAAITFYFQQRDNSTG